MVRSLVLVCLIVMGIPGYSSEHPKKIDKFETISELVLEIKNLASFKKLDNEETVSSRRIGSIWMIRSIARFENPEAVSALIDLVLYEGFDEYDAQLSDGSYSYRVSHNAVLALLDQPLTESPVIRGSDYPDYPALSQADPKRREGAFRTFYGSEYQYALRDCRAWCQEVRDGKRTFQIKGSKLRYNSLGKPVNAPPPRTHSRNPPDTRPDQPRNPTAESHPATNWLIALLVLIIVGGLVRLGIRKA